MAQDEKKISFSAKDSGVSSFMNKVRQDSKRIFDEQLSNAKKLTNETKDQIKFLREYINELQRKNKLENDARRQSIAMRMQYGGEKEQISAREDQGALRGTMAGQSAQITVLKEMLSEMKKGVTPEKKKSLFAEVFSGTVAAGVFRDVVGMARQMPNARTGAEMISPMLSMFGAGTGGSIGAAIDAANVKILGSGLGDVHASAVLSQLGKEAGGFIGDAYYRSLTEQSRLIGAKGRLRGLGLSTNVADLSALGLDFTATAALSESLARAGGTNNQMSAYTAALYSKGRSIDQGTIGTYTGLQRLGTGNLPIDVLLARARKEGVNQLNYDKVIDSVSQLTQTIAQSTGKVDINNAAQIMFGFNRTGGSLGFNNPMSAGIVSSIVQNVSNPSNPLFQAMNYSVLRKRNPNASMVDLLEMMQNPSPEFIQDVIEDVRQRGGGEQFGTIALAGRLGLGNRISTARNLYRIGFGYQGGVTAEEINAMRTETQGLAAQNVAPFEVNQAKITNAFTESFSKGIGQVATLFTDEMIKAIENIIKGKRPQDIGKPPRRTGATGSW